MQIILDSLPGNIALASLVPEYFQIVAVIDGQTGEALRGAIDGTQKMVARGLPPNNSLVNAYSELAALAAKIPAPVLANARLARQKLIEAENAYAKACEPIHAALGHTTTIKPKHQQTRPS